MGEQINTPSKFPGIFFSFSGVSCKGPTSWKKLIWKSCAKDEVSRWNEGSVRVESKIFWEDWPANGSEFCYLLFDVKHISTKGWGLRVDERDGKCGQEIM